MKLRLAEESDVGFIFNSWLKSYRSSYFAKPISNTIYFSEHHKVIEKLAKTSEILIACNQDDPSQIYGYACAERVDGVFVIHYIYVKQTFRRMGVAKALLESFDHDYSDAAVFTHNTSIADKLAAKYNLVYHPYLLINVEPES
jgi:GNAT superfamily N-acetyltransferase